MGLALGILPAIEASGMAFNRNIDLFRFSSAGGPNDPVIARPVNLLNQPNILGAPSGGAFLVAFPGIGGGTIGVQSHLNLWAFDIDMFVPLATAAQNSPNNFSVNPVKRGTPSGPWELLKSKFPDAVGATAGIYGDVPASVASYQGWKAAAESVGYKVVYERGFSPTETDFTADVVRMRQSGVKMVYLTAADVRPTSRMAKAMAQQNFTVDAFVSGGVAYDPNFVTLAGPAGNGVYSEQQMAMYDGEDASIPEVKLLDTWAAYLTPADATGANSFARVSTAAYPGWAAIDLRRAPAFLARRSSSNANSRFDSFDCPYAIHLR